MKITLDHNCIIDLVQRSQVGADVTAIVQDPAHQCYVVNIGASEMRERGVRPDSYAKFEELLTDAGIAHLPRLHPMLIFDVSFWNQCQWGSEPAIKLAHDIELALFGEHAVPPTEGIDSPAGRKWLNRICDIHSMWCHIHHGNDVFLTRDSNFFKESKITNLEALGANHIYAPSDMRHNKVFQLTGPAVGGPGG